MEDRVKKLETITGRLMRRSGKTAVAMTPPIPISYVVSGDDIKGIIFKYMFPCSGVVKSGLVKLDHKPKKHASLSVRLFDDSDSQTIGFSINTPISSKSIDISVNAGDCLEVSLEPYEDIFTEVWISFIYIPSLAMSDKEAFLIDTLETNRSNFELTLIEDKNA
jgi:hypothetical protein